MAARIGPPKVRLEAEDKAVAVHLSPPGAEDGAMWQLDHLNFAYSVVFWSNASGAQVRGGRAPPPPPPPVAGEPDPATLTRARPCSSVTDQERDAPGQIPQNQDSQAGAGDHVLREGEGAPDHAAEPRRVQPRALREHHRWVRADPRGGGHGGC